MLDARPDRIDLRDRPYRPPLLALPPSMPLGDIKAYFSEPSMIILDQGVEGACTGFGLAAVINHLRWPHRGDVEKFKSVSPRMLYHLARIYDEWPGEDYHGSSCRGAMKGWHRHGVCLDETWPYRNKDGLAEFVKPEACWEQEAGQCPLGTYYRVNKDSLHDMQAAIFDTGALYASARVHDGWMESLNSIHGSLHGLPVIPSKAKTAGGHAFAIVGYTRSGFIVQNSWGKNWGMNGVAVLPYQDWLDNGMDVWVASLGAPILNASSAYYKKGNVDYRLINAPVMTATEDGRPWDMGKAYAHTVVLGNNGQAINRSLVNESAAASLRSILIEQPSAWFKNPPMLIDGKPPKPRIVVYAHGGLNSEDSAMERVRILAPYFKANGIYPIFVCWRTGFLEALSGLIRDRYQSESEPKTKGVLSNIKGRVSEAKDRAIEALCHNVLGLAVWKEIKQNAMAAATPINKGGPLPPLLTLSRAMQELKKENPALEVHLVGHSAGAILLGHFLSAGLYNGYPAPEGLVNSCTLLAPACTMDFAAQHFQRAIEDKVMKKKDLHVEVLSDERELADSVGPYGKSLLYLVSRALEDHHKTPLLGMARAWNREQCATWHPDTIQSVTNWLDFWKKAPAPKEHIEKTVSNGLESIPMSHGSFDNDIFTMSRILARIAGHDFQTDLRYPVTRLDY